MDKLSTAVKDELTRLIGNSHVGQQLFDHLVHGGPWDGKLVILLWIWGQTHCCGGWEGSVMSCHADRNLNKCKKMKTF